MALSVTSYIHPIRTFLPCTGAGRHINNVLLQLFQSNFINLQLLFSQQWLTDQKQLPHNCPLQPIPFQTFPMPENQTERLWKLIDYPSMDRYVPDDTDWLYTPMETYIPVKKTPVAATIHDIQAFEPHLPWSNTWHHRWFRYKWGHWVRRTLTQSRLVFTVSEFSKQRMVTLLGADERKIIVVGNGIEASFFAAAHLDPVTLPRPLEAPYVFMVGGLRQPKGGDYYLALAQALTQRHSPIQIVIAGQIDPIYARAAEMYDNLHLLGVVPDEDLPKLMRGALCLLFLSLYEGFGIPPLEAMAVGIPAVVANRASLPEVVGESGIVVEPEATEEIVDILLNLEADSVLCREYGQQGRQHAAQYTWPTCADRVIDAFYQYA